LTDTFANQIRTLWKNPYLGTLIRDVHLDLVGSIPGFRTRPPKPLIHGHNSLDRWHLSRATRHFLDKGLTKSSRLPNDMGKWCYRSAVPVFLLLAMAPNVTAVHLDISNRWRMDGVANRLPDGTYTPKVTFPSLRRLRLTLITGALAGMESGCAVRALLAASPNLQWLELCRFGPLGPSAVNLPPRLAYLFLYDAEVTSGDVAALVRTTPQLRVLCMVFTNERSNRSDSLRDVMAAILGPLSKLPAAQTLKGLVFWGLRFDPTQIPVLAGLPALKRLAITCGPTGQLNQGLLAGLLTRCARLENLLLNGAEGLGRAGMLNFAETVSRLQFPSFRKLVLSPREILFEETASSRRTAVTPNSAYYGQAWEQLQEVTKPPFAELLHDGGVKLVLKRLEL
jgi:hypothetical protein